MPIFMDMHARTKQLHFPMELFSRKESCAVFRFLVLHIQVAIVFDTKDERQSAQMQSLTNIWSDK